MAGTHRLVMPAGKHRAERESFAARVAPNSGLSSAALGGIAMGTLSVAAGALVPGLANAALALGDGGDIPGTQPAGATVAVAVPAGAAFAPPSSDDLARLRFCESTDRYSIATGNGFYGAYQFDLQTWKSLGLEGLPQQAVPQLQDAAANALEQSRGWEPWPACSSHLGLIPRRVHGVPATEVIATLDPTVAPTSTSGTPTSVIAVKTGTKGTGNGPTAVTTPGAPTFATKAPPYTGKVLSVANRAKYRADVRLWQERMAARGWAITPDGYFGAQSQAVARPSQPRSTSPTGCRVRWGRSSGLRPGPPRWIDRPPAPGMVEP